MTHELGPLKVLAFPIAVFDEFGRSIDDKVQDYAAAEVHLAVAAGRERCALICDKTLPYPFRPSIEAAHAIRKG